MRRDGTKKDVLLACRRGWIQIYIISCLLPPNTRRTLRTKGVDWRMRWGKGLMDRFACLVAEEGVVGMLYGSGELDGCADKNEVEVRMWM